MLTLPADIKYGARVYLDNELVLLGTQYEYIVGGLVDNRPEGYTRFDAIIMQGVLDSTVWEAERNSLKQGALRIELDNNNEPEHPHTMNFDFSEEFQVVEADLDGTNLDTINVNKIVFRIFLNPKDYL